MVGALGPITVAIVSITLTWAGHLRSRVGIKAVGHIDAGLPPFTVWQTTFLLKSPTCVGVSLGITWHLFRTLEALSLT